MLARPKPTTKTAAAIALCAMLTAVMAILWLAAGRAAVPGPVDTAAVERLVRRYSPDHARTDGAGRSAQGLPDLLTRAFSAVITESATDRRAADALDLLQSGNPAAALAPLRAIAEDKAGHGDPSRRRAGDAFQHLAAIASLVDAAAAREAFARAAVLDPDNAATLAWHGWLQLEAGSIDSAEQALQRFIALQRGSVPDSPQTQWAMLGLGDIAMRRGKLPDALERYRDAAAMAGRLVGAAGDGSRDQHQRSLAVAHQRIGDVLFALGNLAGADESYRSAHAVFTALAAAGPDVGDRQYDLVVSYLNLGSVAATRGSLADALDAYQGALAIADRLIAIDRGSALWLRTLAICYQRTGDVLAQQGEAASAHELHRAALAVFEQLAAIDPSNAGWQRDLGIAVGKVAERLIARGEVSAGLAQWRRARDIAGRLAAANPADAQWQRDWIVAQGHVASALISTGNLDGALAGFDGMLPVQLRLAAADPTNTTLQRDIAVLHKRAGDVLMAQSRNQSGAAADKRIAALQRFRLALAIHEQLAAIDTGNAQWQADLADACSKAGQALAEDGRITDALPVVERSLMIGERLAAADPASAVRQRSLAISLEHLADIHQRAGQTSEAIAAFKQALDTYRGLAARNVDDLQSRLFIVAPLWRLASLEGAAGRDRLVEALAILQPLAATGRLDAARLGWIDRIKAQLAGAP